MSDRSAIQLQPHHTLLLDWWFTNRRSFPWREDDVTGYQMVVTEMLLWKTRAEMVDSVWSSFFKAFPTASSLSVADELDVRALIATLGLRKRSVLLISMAKDLMTRFDGQVPRSMDELMSMDGVGDYVASAVLSFHFKEDACVFDANVRRIVYRLLDAEDEKIARSHAASLVPSGWSSEWNYAMLDLGAIICRWRANCKECPLASICVTSHAGSQKHA